MFDDIILFVKLVNVGSFSKLSKLLNVSQPTISRRIKNMEDNIGKELLIRSTNNFRLSEAGELLYEKFKSHEVYLNNSLAEVLGKSSVPTSTLRVALPIAISKTIISPYLSDFLEQHQNINLIVSFTSGVIDLIKDGFDIAVSLNMPKAQNNVAKLLYTFNLQIYASPKYFEQHKKIETLEDSNKQAMIGYLAANGTPHKKFTVKNLHSGISTEVTLKNPRLYIDNILHMEEIARSGKLLVAGWDALFENDLRSGQLVKVLPEYSIQEIPCYLIRPTLELSSSQAAFANFIDECFLRYKHK